MKKILSLILISAFLSPNIVLADRFITVGYEWNRIVGSIEHTGQLGSVSTTSTAHSGSYAVTSSGSTGNHSWNFRADAVADSYARVYFKVGTPDATSTIMAYGDTTGFLGAKVRMQPNRTLVASNSDFSLNTYGATALTAGEWYCFQMWYDETGNDLTLRVDQDICGTTAYFTNAVVDDVGGGGLWRVGIQDASTWTGALTWDDVAINNAGGTVQNSYPGEGKIIVFVPNAAGYSNCTTGTYAMVNEVPPDDTMTSGSTMCELDVNPTNAFFNITDTAGLIDSYDTINLVQIMARMREETTGTTGYHLHISSGGTATTTSASGDAGNATSVFTNPVGTTAFRRTLVAYVDPATSAAWTTTGIDSLQIGAGTVDGTPDSWLATIAAMIEYQDGSAPPVGGSTSTIQSVWDDDI